MSCLHPYCQGCLNVTPTCTVCRALQGNRVEFATLKQKYDAYKATKTGEKYREMFDELNVNGVQCVHGNSCKAKEMCKYDHSLYVHVEDDGEWMCPKDGFSVEMNIPACPFCGTVKPSAAPGLSPNPPQPHLAKHPQSTDIQGEQEAPGCWDSFLALLCCRNCDCYCSWCCYIDSSRKSGEEKPLKEKANDEEI